MVGQKPTKESDQKPNAAVILGAGFSFVGGLPLTRDLFDSKRPLPQAQSRLSQDKYENVRWAFENATRKDPNLSAEQWLAYLYQYRENAFQQMMWGTTWDEAVRYALAQLVVLPKGSNTHYYFGIGSAQCHPTHKMFWEKVAENFSMKYIVTLNYDILVEQCLNFGDSAHRTPSRCRYGGFQHTQVVRKMTNVVTKAHELMPLGDEFVLYKLHGSVNWAWERHSPTLKIHHDVRAVFRVDDKHGVPAIVPPIPEKEMPPEFAQIWNEAKKVLIETPIWIVCGYSLPDYDEALVAWFREVLRTRKTTTILLLDPSSEQLASKWKALGTCHVIPLKGLPEGLSQNWGMTSAPSLNV